MNVPGVQSAERRAGDVVAGATLVKIATQTTQHQVWRADLDGEKVAVYVLPPSATEDDAYRFHAAALKMLKTTKSAIAGVLRVRAVDPDGRAFMADLWTVGNVADLPALAWELDRRLEVFRALCATVERLHAASLVHGGLAPSSVLLDDDLQPVIGAVEIDEVVSVLSDPVRAPYVAPEIAAGGSPRVASDVFALGQILHFLLLDKQPVADAEDLPRLDDLAPTAPAGLVRIVRKCTSAKPAKRYANVAELAADVARYAEWESVGVAHPAVTEANTTATFAPTARAAAPPPSGEPRRSPPKPTGEARTPATQPKPRAVAPPKVAPKVVAPSWARLGALLGVSIVGAAIILGYISGSHAIVWRILSAVGLGCVGLMVPVDAAKARFGVAAAVAVLGFFIDIGGRATVVGATSALASPNPQTAAGAMRALRGAGARRFSNANVTGGDFSGIDFEGTDCDFVDFSSANLSSTSFVRATLVGATMRDANLEGAVMTDANVLMIVDLNQAKCDERTKLPSGWRCETGHPRQ